MMVELPSVETACGMLQQEEAQRSVLRVKEEPASFAMNSTEARGKEPCAMYSKEGNVKGKDKEIPHCEACGKLGHLKRDCWTVKGYPSGYSRAQNFSRGREGNYNFRGGRGGRWNRGGRNGRGGRSFAGNVEQSGSSSGGDIAGITPKQLEQLIRALPRTPKENDEDDCEMNYAGMVAAMNVKVEQGSWIVDSGATNHMTGDLKLLCDVRKPSKPMKTRLPNGETSDIEHVGTVVLKNGLRLKEVLHVPAFKHHLISVQKN